MQLWELLLTAVALSMDAFAVSVSKGLAMQKVTFKKALTVGIWFGGFQALMPLLGYLLGTQFQKQIEAIDHWVAFVLLALIGGNMIREALFSKEDQEETADLGFRAMLLLAIATSIDALAVGITYACLKVDVVPAVSFIGIVTLTLSAAGVFIGHIFGKKYQSKAELAGGIILLLIGTKILLEHMGVIVAR